MGVLISTVDVCVEVQLSPEILRRIADMLENYRETDLFSNDDSVYSVAVTPDSECMDSRIRIVWHPNK